MAHSRYMRNWDEDWLTDRAWLFSSIDHGMFVLNVDLWNEDGSREVNLVRHSSGTPSISSTTPASYGSLTSSTPAYANILPSHRDSPYPGSDMGGYAQPGMPPYNMAPGYGQPTPPYGQTPQPGYPQCELHTTLLSREATIVAAAHSLPVVLYLVLTIES
jgi:hypothetical protein